VRKEIHERIIRNGADAGRSRLRLTYAVLPADFVDTSESRYIDIGELGMHPVVGSESPPLLLALGWPENWCA
jgi:hypothetical protein